MLEQLIRPEVEFIYSPVINFAMQQNHVPVIRKLVLKNKSERPLKDLTITISCEPGFALPWTHKIGGLQPDEIIDLTAINLKVSADFVAAQTERIAGALTLTILEANHPVYSQTHDISILAFDQWNGIGVLPEMLAAFVTPNNPEVSRIIRKASSILQDWTGSPSFDEYQTHNPDRVKKQMAAIYEAIAELGIVYCSVPASFEETGQRIRLIDAICSQQLGNCLDLSLFYASCLEAIGLRPFVVVIKGHAFSGAWLIEDSFADSANDDVSLLTKRIAEGINEIVLVESTCMNAGQRASFDDAVRAANNHLLIESNFVLFLDIKRSRFSGVRPLPLRVQTLKGWEIVEPTPGERDRRLPDEILPGQKLHEVASIDVSKQRLWERKLLDLSLRNNLLNLRLTKTTIQLISSNLSQLEDALADGLDLALLPKPTDWDNPLRHAGLYQALHQSDPITDLVKHEFSQKRVRTYLPEIELTAVSLNLFRAAKLSMEENGANTLFVALGLLKWYETDVSEKPRFAPLILVPVEMVKRAAQKVYSIRGREEESVMNITLLEMLRQDFGINIGGLDVLPKDDNGVDVKTVFSIIRQSIMSRKRWDVVDQAVIGTFSFSKFIMWNDIHNNADKLARNKVVASLIAGKMQWEVSDNMINFHSADQSLHPSEIALPISTDSSQLEAIQASVNNHSFVLHGPPGTGKSQTITNIIANALYNGKKVLFVAEKMAALHVVQTRLEALGLGAFCLELHSNKSKKSTVLEQLKRTAELERKPPPAGFKQEADKLHALRSELNGYVEALHKVHHFGISLYDAFAGYAQYAAVGDDIAFPASSIQSLSKATVAQWDVTVQEMNIISHVCGGVYGHPLSGIELKTYSQHVKSEARKELQHYIACLVQLQKKATRFLEAAKLDINLNSAADFHCCNIIAELLLTLPDTPASMLSCDNLEQTMAQLQEVVGHGIKRDKERTELLTGHTKDILSFQATKSLVEWNAASQSWFLPKWLKHRAIKNALTACSTGTKRDSEEVVTLLEKVIIYQNEHELIQANAPMLTTLTGFLWKAGEGNWSAMTNVADRLVLLARQVSSLMKDGVRTKEWRVAMAREWPDGSNAYLALHSTTMNEFTVAFDATRSSEQRLKQLLAIDFNDQIAEHAWLSKATALAERWLQHIEGLRDWTSWNNVKENSLTSGLSPVVAALETNKIQSAGLMNSYKKAFYRSSAEFIFSAEPQLSSFNGKLFEEKISRFREISGKFETLTRAELFARLASKIPSFTQEASQSSEIAILQKAIRSNARGTSLRKLFDSIPNLLPRLHPCMLMSPISVAQYFDANSAKFDLVVFDEASQMPTCEAIGAMARGQNVIIVGDPKQMPPTSFFSSTRVDEDNIEKEDLESILDDCLALSMPSKHLLWHYRSKHESLIAFSNAKYYENKLLTFPSPDDIESKVTFVAVEGYYDRGKTKQNNSEAHAIVHEVRRRLSDPVLSKRTIGIVTFSSIQQILIDDLLAELWKERPDLELVANNPEEPLFIKNLENVQGDERDVILFSVGYGPDKEGKVSLNFGPINRNGGWRRLNVAVSRARYEMKVFSTLRADKIDITRSASEGVAGLRSFLEYAENGKAVLSYAGKTHSAYSTSFIELIAGDVRKAGYEVKTNIGCSGYRIDIGVISKKNPSRYIMGILCDGHNYAGSKTARDREIVQPDVLRLLGWSLYRIWSVEWWEAGERLLQDLMNAIRVAEEAWENVPTAIESVGEVPLTAALQPPVLEETNVVPNTLPETREPLRNYEVCSLEIVLSTSSDDFLQPVNRQRILMQIGKVVEMEAPISRNLLCKRVLSAWGITRQGARLTSQFDNLFSYLNLKQTGTNGKLIFWKASQVPATYSDFRVATGEGSKRDADDLPAEEVANAVNHILQNQISLSREELVRETAKLFGFARTGGNVETAVINGLNIALSKQFAVQDGNRIIVKG